jgi:putative hydrolase of the HAD superfamily
LPRRVEGAEYLKPHLRRFARLQRHWPLVDSSRFLYVADNPLKDFVAPRAREWRTVRIIRGGEHCHRLMAGRMRPTRLFPHLMT